MGPSRPSLVIRREKMRIAWVLSISRIRKVGESLTVTGAARFTQGRSGRTRLGPDRCHEGEPGQSRRSQHFCQRSGHFVCLDAAFSRNVSIIYGPYV